MNIRIKFKAFLVLLYFLQASPRAVAQKVKIGFVEDRANQHPIFATPYSSVFLKNLPLFELADNHEVKCILCSKSTFDFNPKKNTLKSTFHLKSSLWEDRSPVKCADFWLSYKIIKSKLESVPQRRFWQSIVMNKCDPINPHIVRYTSRGSRWGMWNTRIHPTPSHIEGPIWEAFGSKNYLQNSRYIVEPFLWGLSNSNFFAEGRMQIRSYPSYYSLIYGLEHGNIHKTSWIPSQALDMVSIRLIQKNKFLADRRLNSHFFIMGANQFNQEMSPSKKLQLYDKLNALAQIFAKKYGEFVQVTPARNKGTPATLPPPSSQPNQQPYLGISSNSGGLKNQFIRSLSRRDLRPSFLPKGVFEKRVREMKYKDFVFYTTRFEPWFDFKPILHSGQIPFAKNRFIGANIHGIDDIHLDSTLQKASRTWKTKDFKRRIHGVEEMVNEKGYLNVFWQYQDLRLRSKIR